eukprot:Opistho-2@30541
MPQVQDVNKWQWTTVASDALVAYTAYYCTDKLFQRNRIWAAIACAIICLAASVGTLRFGPFPKLKKFHLLLAAAGGSISLPLIGYSVQRWYKIYMWTDSTLCIAIFGGFFARTVLPLPVEARILYDVVASALGLTTIYVADPPGGGIGVLVLVVSVLIAVLPSGLRVKSKTAHILATDVFHVGLAAALRLFMQGLM